MSRLVENDALGLARLAATGNAAATTKLLRSVASDMERVIRGVLGPSSPDVDDAMQQALLSLIRALPTFRGECAPVGFACGIAFRTALTARRSARRRRARLDSTEPKDDHPDERPSPGSQSEAWRRTALVQSLLDELPVEQAEALVMRAILGWSVLEIAEARGVPLNTVRSRLRLAREAMRAMVEADPALAEALGIAS